MIAQHLAPVVGVVPVAPGHFVLTCHAPELAAAARPGSFVNVKAEGEGFDPLLRKPFSVYAANTETGHISLLFSVVGATTRTMARKQSGDIIDMVGPLGGHLFAPDPRPGVHHVCVGGGYGVPPLVFLSHQLKAAGQDVSFVIGARTKDLLLCESELREAGFSTHTATDDGSCGFRGLVTDRLVQLLPVKASASVYCCGPTPMMRAVAKGCEERGVPCQISMEVSMPCGVGVCMGCVLDLKDGRRVRCCTDGPVFQAEDVQWP